MKEKEIYAWYNKEKELLEKRKNKRTFICICIPSLTLFFILISKAKDIELLTFLGSLILCFVLGSIDILIHYSIFSSTLLKNKEEDIQLEKTFKQRLKENE